MAEQRSDFDVTRDELVEYFGEEAADEMVKNLTSGRGRRRVGDADAVGQVPMPGSGHVGQKSDEAHETAQAQAQEARDVAVLDAIQDGDYEKVERMSGRVLRRHNRTGILPAR
jgi:hypothetical protein